MTSPVRTQSGTPIHVDEHGEGPPVLAVHGLGGGAWFFADAMPALAQHARVAAVDLPGTGGSVPAPRMGIIPWAEDLCDFAAAHFDDPAIVVGHSMGTIIGLQMWALRPDIIRAFVFVGGLPTPRDPVKARLSARAAHIEQHGLAGLGHEVAAANLSRRTLERRQHLVDRFAARFEAQVPGVYARCCRILVSASADAIVPSVTVPCIAIVGEEDQYAPPADVRAFASQVPGGCPVHVLPDCAHLPFLEAPDAFAGTVTGFIASLC